MTNMKMWKTKDGQKIRVRDLGDRHLLNIVRLLERTHQREVDATLLAPCPFHGDMAIDAFDAMQLQAMKSEPDDFYPIYTDLCDVVIRRGLGAEIL